MVVAEPRPALLFYAGIENQPRSYLQLSPLMESVKVGKPGILTWVWLSGEKSRVMSMTY